MNRAKAPWLRFRAHQMRLGGDGDEVGGAGSLRLGGGRDLVG